MIPFMNEDFLLTTPTARKLYHEAAAKMPIYDYHCHLDPQQIYGTREHNGLLYITTIV